MANVEGPKGSPLKVSLDAATLQANWSPDGLTFPTTVFSYGPDGKCTMTHTAPERGVKGPVPMLDARLGRL